MRIKIFVGLLANRKLAGNGVVGNDLTDDQLSHNRGSAHQAELRRLHLDQIRRLARY